MLPVTPPPMAPPDSTGGPGVDRPLHRDRPAPASLAGLMGSLIKKRRKRMRKKKHKKMLKATRWQRRAGK